MAKCSICNGAKSFGNNRSHALNSTNRSFSKNLQKVNSVIYCTSCWRTAKKHSKRA